MHFFPLIASAPMRWTTVALAASLAGCGGGASTPAAISTHVLGGTISGLSASGLVIANGSDSLAVASGATSFSMPTAVQTGAAYALTVKTQPSGQQCSFANGAGTMPDADMRNAVLTCATQAVGLTGSISGLSAVGLVLANGSDTITVDPNTGTFSLPAVAVGSSWNITVKNQPAGQVCTVVNGSGQMGTSAPVNLQVSCVAATASGGGNSSPVVSSYTVGGTVTGLSSGSLVLANGSDSVTVSANGAFTFSQAVATGASYSVTMQTPPTGLSCVVSNATGAMGSASVGNVTVACSANTYTLGGSITGLTTAGLLLANGSDTLSVASNASAFTMGQPVAYGSAYSIAVQTQPYGLRCTPSNNTGTMGGANVSSVAVACAAIVYQVTTFAGSTSGFADGVGTAAQFDRPFRTAVDANGTVYVIDRNNNRVRKIAADGTVTTLAGSATTGSADGTGSAAGFFSPTGIAVDTSGNVIVADTGNHRIRKVTPSGVVTTIAGSTAGFADGVGSSAQFSNPAGVAVDSAGNIYVADSSNNRIRKILPNGTVSTIAGGNNGYADGAGSVARFFNPNGLKLDGNSNIYVADVNNHRIRKIATDGTVSTLAGSTQGYSDGVGATAQFSSPYDVALDSAGNVYVADLANYVIRKIAPDGTTSTFAGVRGNPGTVDGAPTTAKFSLMTGVTIALGDIFYVTDYGNDRIRKIAP